MGDLVWTSLRRPTAPSAFLSYAQVEEVYKFIDRHKTEIDKQTTEKGGGASLGLPGRGSRYLTCNKDVKTVADLRA